MATSEAMYFKVPLDGKESQRSTGSCISKAGMVFLGGSCLVLLSIMAIFAYGSMLTSTSAGQSTTSLLGISPSLRTPSHMIPQTTINQLPGAGPWKDLALAGIQDANQCGRDVSMKAHRVKAALASMDSKDKAAIRDVMVRAEGMREQITSIPDSPEGLLKGAGATGPLGFWDPLGFSTNLPAGRLLFYREVELKHGRVCMLASLGILVAEQFHPLFGGDIDVPAYIAYQAIPLQAFWVAVAAVIAIPEVGYSIPTFNTPQDGRDYIDAYTFTMKTDRVPGDIGYDPLGLKPTDPNEFLEMQNKEINNGRLAMIATAGMIAQELVSGQKIF